MEKLRYGAGRIDTGESRERRKWRYDLGNRAEHDLLRETAGIQDSVIKKTSTPSSGYEFCNRWNTTGGTGVRQLPDLFPSARIARRRPGCSIDRLFSRYASERNNYSLEIGTMRYILFNLIFFVWKQECLHKRCIFRCILKRDE